MSDTFAMDGDASVPVVAVPSANGEVLSPATAHVNGHHRSAPFPKNPSPQPRADAPDHWQFLELIGQRWWWLALGGGVFASLGLAAGLFLWKTSYTAPAQLIRYDSPTTTEVFGFRQVSPQTFISLLRAPDLLARVGAMATPPLPADALAATLRVMPERNSDIIVVAVTGRDPEATVELVNLYAREAVRFTQETQGRSATELKKFVAEQLARVEAEITVLNQQTTNLPKPKPPVAPAPRPSPLMEKLQAAQLELVELLSRYTEAHPDVIAQRARIAALESQLHAQPAPASDAEAIPPDANVEINPAAPDPVILRSKLQTLEGTRLQLLARQNAAQSFAANPPGYFNLLAPATSKDVIKQGRRAKVLFLIAFLGLIGVVAGTMAALFAEVMDGRLKTSADLARVARLPVLASAGNLNRMTKAERNDWAFRAWTHLQGQLSPSPNHGLVLAITSSSKGEGRSTWLNLLAEAATQLGFRVLTIATRSPWPEGEAVPKKIATTPGELRVNGTTPGNSTALTSNVLATPAEVTQRLTNPNSDPRVHIPLPGWVWDLERRKQWQSALQQWAQIDNVVILVELPPASMPEAVLLAENLPNLIWLADGGKALAGKTREQLETLRRARCRLSGAVLNHAPKSFVKTRFSRWVG